MGGSSRTVDCGIVALAIRIGMAVLCGGMAGPALAGGVQAEWVGTSGSWLDPTRWSTNPSIPNNGETTYDVIIRNVFPMLDVPGGVTVQNLTLDKVFLGGTENLTVNGNLEMQDSYLALKGSTTVLGGIAFSGGRSYLHSTTLNNAGLIVHSGGSQLEQVWGATFNNRPTGIIDIRTDTDFWAWSSFLTTESFNNAGTFRKSAGSGKSHTHILFNNDGLVDVQSGTLQITNGGSGSGTFNVGLGSMLEFTQGYTLKTGATFTGSGKVKGGFTVDGKATVATDVTLEGLRCNGELKAANGGTILLAYGNNPVGAGILSTDPGGTLQINNGTLGDLTVHNAGSMTLPSSFESVTGTINNSGMLTIAPSLVHMATIRVPIHNTGTFDISPGYRYLRVTRGGSNSGRINVPKDSGLEFLGDFTMGDGSVIAGEGGVSLLDAATVTGRVAVSGSLWLGPQTRLQGATIKAISGGAVSCTIADPQASTGTLVTEPGGTVVFSAAAPISVPWSIDNAGTLTVSSRRAVSLTGPIVQLQGSTLTAGTWEAQSDATLDFDGRLVTVNEGNIVLRGSGARFKAIVPLAENRGHLTITDYNWYQPTVAFANTGTLTINSSGVFRSTGSFQSTGTIGGNGSFTNLSGTVDIGGTQAWEGRARLEAVGGIVNLNTDAGSGDSHTLRVLVDPRGCVNFNSTQHLATLRVSYGSARMRRHGGLLLATNDLAIEGWGLLDLADNAMLVHGTPETREQILDSITAAMKVGRTPTLGLRKGLLSSEAEDNPLTGLAVILNDRGDGKPIFSTFRGESVGVNDVLVGYSWNGDANLDGTIDIRDYFLIDSGFITQKGGYRNGDFNLDGVVNIADYFLIDSAFLGQRGVLCGGTGRVMPMPVPEPTTQVVLLAGLMMIWGGRGRRSC